MNTIRSSSVFQNHIVGLRGRTDSRMVADTTLSHEFELASAMGMTDDELRRCNATAYEAKFG